MRANQLAGAEKMGYSALTLLRTALLTTLASALLPSAVQAQIKVTVRSRLPEPGRFKASNGILIQWNVNPKDPDRDAIEAFDVNGQRVLGVNVFKMLPSARAVSISDVAVRSDQSVAVAAVISGRDDSIRPALLYVGWDGKLVRAIDLDASREIGWLEFDDAGNLWALTDYLGKKAWADTNAAGIDCPLGPLIFVYDREGQVVRSLLKQVDFPDGLQEGHALGGRVSFGITPDKVWFWQPARHRMIVADWEGRNVKRIPTPLPVSRSWLIRASFHRRAEPQIQAGLSVLLPSGQVLVDIASAEPDVPSGTYILRGERLHKGSIDDARSRFLAGVDGSEFVFVSTPKLGSSDFQITRELARNF